jgi:type IV pilus modification protein PilV
VKRAALDAGFSLIEVLCAILILGIGIVGLTHGLTTALSASKESELQTKAALLAAGQIEQLRADGYLSNGMEEGDGEGPSAAYHWQQTISSTDLAGLHEVHVAVSLARSGELIYELRTLLFDPPVELNSTESSKRTDNTNGRRDDRRSR